MSSNIVNIGAYGERGCICIAGIFPADRFSHSSFRPSPLESWLARCVKQSINFLASIPYFIISEHIVNLSLSLPPTPPCLSAKASCGWWINMFSLDPLLSQKQALKIKFHRHCFPSWLLLQIECPSSEIVVELLLCRTLLRTVINCDPADFGELRIAIRRKRCSSRPGCT